MLEALVDATDQAKNLWRMQAVLSHTIDIYADVEEEKDLARGLAEHEAHEQEYALLELQRARDPAWE